MRGRAKKPERTRARIFNLYRRRPQIATRRAHKTPRVSSNETIFRQEHTTGSRGNSRLVCSTVYPKKNERARLLRCLFAIRKFAACGGLSGKLRTKKPRLRTTHYGRLLANAYITLKRQDCLIKRPASSWRRRNPVLRMPARIIPHECQEREDDTLSVQPARNPITVDIFSKNIP